MAHCGDCQLSTNLWLCLSCGYLGCGNNHALLHKQTTSHSVVVKLGTISPEGTASVYCYACDDEVKDPYLSDHLANFGIIIDRMVKTEKTILEMNIDLNMNL